MTANSVSRPQRHPKGRDRQVRVTAAKDRRNRPLRSPESDEPNSAGNPGAEDLRRHRTIAGPSAADAVDRTGETGRSAFGALVESPSPTFHGEGKRTSAESVSAIWLSSVSISGLWTARSWFETGDTQIEDAGADRRFVIEVVNVIEGGRVGRSLAGPSPVCDRTSRRDVRFRLGVRRDVWPHPWDAAEAVAFPARRRVPSAEYGRIECCPLQGLGGAAALEASASRWLWTSPPGYSGAIIGQPRRRRSRGFGATTCSSNCGSASVATPPHRTEWPFSARGAGGSRGCRSGATSRMRYLKPGSSTIGIGSGVRERPHPPRSWRQVGCDAGGDHVGRSCWTVQRMSVSGW